MGRRRFTAEFEREAVKLAAQPGTVVRRVAEEQGLHATFCAKSGLSSLQRASGKPSPACR